METKAKFRQYLKDFVQQTLNTSLEKLNDVQRSKEMTRFYIDQVLRSVAPGLVPDDQEDLENAVIDGHDDCGVDFIYRSDGHVLIVQAKYRSLNISEPQDHYSHFCEVLHRLQSSKFKKNSGLEEALCQIEWESDFFDLHYITLGKAGDNLRSRADQGPGRLPPIKGIADRCEVSLLDEIDLNVRLREAQSAGEFIEEPVPVRFSENDSEERWISRSADSKRSCYLGFVSGNQFAELYYRYKYSLFSMNIRDYVGDTATNKGIVSTALNHPNDFLFYNNGVSAIATSVEEDDDEGILYCKKLSIINGAQTVRSLAKAHSKDKRAVADVKVLVRITTYSLGKEPTFIEDVTRFNNTQNAIRISDFRSNDPVQRDISRRFGELARDGKKFLYKNKRRQERAPSRIPIGMEEFTKTLYAFRFGPDDMSGGTAYLFDTSATGGYCKVFGDGTTIWAKIPDDDFKLLSGTWFLCERVRSHWDAEKEKAEANSQSKAALERRWIAFFAAGELLRIIYARRGFALDEDLMRLAKPSAIEDHRLDEAISRLTKMACTAMINAYSRVASRAQFAHRNWFRSNDTLQDIRTELRSVLTYFDDTALPLIRPSASAAHA